MSNDAAPAKLKPANGRAVDILIARREKRLESDKERRYEHDLGDGTSIVVRWKPWTLREQDAVFGNQPGFAPAQFVAVLVAKALTDDGKPMFADADMTELLDEVDPRDVKKIAGVIMAELSTLQAAAKAGDLEGK